MTLLEAETRNQRLKMKSKGFKEAKRSVGVELNFRGRERQKLRVQHLDIQLWSAIIVEFLVLHEKPKNVVARCNRDANYELSLILPSARALRNIFPTTLSFKRLLDSIFHSELINALSTPEVHKKR